MAGYANSTSCSLSLEERGVLLNNSSIGSFTEHKESELPPRLEKYTSVTSGTEIDFQEISPQERWQFFYKPEFDTLTQKEIQENLYTPDQLLFAEIVGKQDELHNNCRKIEKRIELLKSIAEEEEGLFNSLSKDDFWSFMKHILFFNRPKIFLLENGNLRAVWKGVNGAHIGLQFLGNGNIQYVIFVRRPGARKISRSYGRDTFSGVLEYIAASDLEGLIHL